PRVPARLSAWPVYHRGDRHPRGWCSGERGLRAAAPARVPAADPVRLTIMTFDSKPGQYQVRGLNLAQAGRHQIRLAEHEMPGLMALRSEFGPTQPLAGQRITGSLHMTVQTA